MFELTGMDAVNRELTQHLVAESLKVPTDHRSNVGGWHSRTDLHARPEACFRTIVQEILIRVRETSERVAKESGLELPPLSYRAHAWAMVMRDGDYTLPHDHSEVHWGSVYYPDAGDADDALHPESGVLGLIDPRHGGRPIPGLDIVGKTFYSKPATGRLLVFPGWLMHYVNAYRGNRPRVAISCNVIFYLAPPGG